MHPPALTLTRDQILSFRHRTNALGSRLPTGNESLRVAAWAGLQDSMPRAALLSIHARVDSTPPSILDNASMIHVWGPRYNVFLVAKEDTPVFTVGRMPRDERGRQRAENLAARIAKTLGDDERPYSEVAREIGADPNALRYATTTGTILLNWRGAGKPTIRVAPRPELDAADMGRELARRYLHIYGPATAESFARWAGTRSAAAVTVFKELHAELTPVSTPVGEAWILNEDEQAVRDYARPRETVRLLPSGDAYYLLQGRDRDLLVPDVSRRDRLWTSRVWPGAILARGEIIGTWRRSRNTFTLEPWGRLTRVTKEDIEAEARALPLPEDSDSFEVRWI